MTTDEQTDIPVYEIDPKKKYILSIKGGMTMEMKERIRNNIIEWLHDDTMPFLIINGDTVKLVKVEDK